MENEVRLSDVGFDTLFWKSNTVLCLILYVFNEQRHSCLRWVTQEPAELWG